MNFTEKEKNYLVHLLDKDIESILKDIGEKIQSGDGLAVLEMMSGLQMPIELKESIKAFTLPFAPEEPKAEPKPKKAPKVKAEPKPKRKYTKRTKVEPEKPAEPVEPAEKRPPLLKAKDAAEPVTESQEDDDAPRRITKGENRSRTCTHCTFYIDGKCFDTDFEVDKNHTCEMFEKKVKADYALR